MEHIQRTIERKIEQSLYKGKAVVVYGARRVGKTTLVRAIEQREGRASRYLNCDEPDVRQALTDATSTALKAFIGNATLVILDEAQRVKNIGLTIKLLVDTYPSMQVIATGSSSFELSNRIREPLTGRAYEFQLLPFSVEELSGATSWQEQHRLLSQRLVFGMYPTVTLRPEEAMSTLRTLAGNTLYRDALEYEGVRHPEVLERLAQALALQIGHEVSYNELATLLGVEKRTVERYVRLLEQAFVIFRLGPFSRNLRNELKRFRKVYFFDVGVRNALINNFNPLHLRQDTGQLWENWLVAERLKRNGNHGRAPSTYFWRTRVQQELDYLEVEGDRIDAYEFKWTGKHLRVPSGFREGYPRARTSFVTPETYRDFVLAPSTSP